MGSRRALRASDSRLKHRGMWRTVMAARIAAGSIALRPAHLPPARGGIGGAVDNVTIVCLALGVGGPARADTPMVEEAKIGVEHAAPRHVVHACVIPIVPVGMAEVMTASATSELKRPALSRTPAEGLPVQVVHTDADARVHVIPDGVANPSGNIAST